MKCYIDYKCFECDGDLIKEKTYLTLELKDTNVELINIPIDKCPKCNEEYFHAKVSEKILEISRNIESKQLDKNMMVDFEDYKI